jgi:hypothetical protein
MSGVDEGAKRLGERMLGDVKVEGLSEVNTTTCLQQRQHKKNCRLSSLIMVGSYLLPSANLYRHLLHNPSLASRN